MVWGVPQGHEVRGVGHVSDERFETLMVPERRVAGNRPGLAALEKAQGRAQTCRAWWNWVM
ncbi:MAG: hypothetical protein ABSH41_27505 [Syntrophobacteraceae bacterium]